MITWSDHSDLSDSHPDCRGDKLFPNHVVLVSMEHYARLLRPLVIRLSGRPILQALASLRSNAIAQAARRLISGHWERREQALEHSIGVATPCEPRIVWLAKSKRSTNRVLSLPPKLVRMAAHLSKQACTLIAEVHAELLRERHLLVQRLSLSLTRSQA